MAGLMLLGYYGVYLLTPWDLGAHLDSSLVRLLLQLWPAAVFFWCLAATHDGRTGWFTAGRSARPRRALGLVLLANAGAAVGIGAVLSRQLAANELAAADRDGAEVRVVLGDGWFGRETHGREVWAWSKGEANLLLRLNAKEPRTVNLRFDIRALGDRTVTAKLEERVIWRGRLREDFEAVAVAGLVLQPGTTAIVFESNAPGIPEAAGAGARLLTYALYNPAVEL